MAKLTRTDLDFILRQIQIGEANAALVFGGSGTPLSQLIDDPLLPHGLRTVDGTFNNLIPGQENFGAADQLFPRMLTPVFGDDQDGDTMSFGPGAGTVTNTNYNVRGNAPVIGQPGVVVGDVADADPRIISNLIADQSSANPAAIAAFNALNPDSPATLQLRNLPDGSANPAFVENLFIQNVAPDEGLSAPYNSWFTLFGQFFDHGLDLVTKGGNGTIYIPLQADDPLIAGDDRVFGTTDDLPASQRFMAVTRTTTFTGPGADGVLGTSDDTLHEAQNTTTSWVDQNQTYTSHASHQAFLREYVLVGGSPLATGKLLEGAGGGLSTWADVKAQARDILGIELSDGDVHNVPLLATDAYGRLLLSTNGKAQLVTTTGLVEGNIGAPVGTGSALRTEHAFLNDIAHHAAPGQFDPDHNPATNNSVPQVADADSGPEGLFGDDRNGATYDNELLDAHYITGDGRGNENIGLTSVHHVFHSEHNRLVELIKAEILANPGEISDPVGFLNDWLLTPVASIPVDLNTLDWNGERLFQAARFGTEMQYQHLVFEEFARKLMPAVNVFAGIQTDIDGAIVAEFAHTVYRFGHSMLNETVDRIDVNGNPVLSGGEQMGLIEAFLNPLAYAARETGSGVAAGEVVRGMTRQVGNEIDEFVSGALQNNLLGLPLDLPAINIARGRDTGIPSLNEARRQFFNMTNDSQLTPYVSWSDFGANLKHAASLINFVAAYGTHASITGATTLADKRAAAILLVNGNTDVNGDGIAEVAPSDRVAFMNSIGVWASGSNGVTTTGLDAVDFWIGGLAEKKMPFGGMLGSTFGFVFETQMERLQDGDRLYYLARTAGLPFLSELEGNSFAELVMRNTQIGGHLPADIFSRPDHILELNQTVQQEADPIGQVSRDNPATPGPDTNYLRFSGAEHVVLGGTNGDDILIADAGDDSLWGDAGNDRLEGGAGNDQIIGGDGNDIITDSFGDDNIKGGDGDDVINAGAGIDLIIAGDGSDFVVAGADEKETIAGEGNDFVLGSDGVDTVFGDGGNDWIEGGGQADLLQGDNGDPFQTSPILGNDVVIGGGGNDDYDMESGDDIAVAGDGTERYEGMLGFDWVTHRGDPIPANTDMLFTGAVPPTVETLRDRMDLIEAVSGWNNNDVLRGDNLTSVDLTAVDVASGQNNALNSPGQIALIDGLQGLLDGAFGGPQTGFGGGNILLGGDGNDVIEGRGGDDLIDGDKWLNVQIGYVDANNVEHRVDSMAAIQAQLFAGTLKPSQLRIVREIVAANGSGDVDTAEYNDIESNYIVSRNELTGTWTVTDNAVLSAGAGNGFFAPPTDEGTDTLRNIEQLRFSDGNGGFTLVSLDPFAANVAATGTIVISDSTPDEDQPLSVDSFAFSDINGSVNQSTIQFHWEAETAPGIWTRLLSNSATFTPGNAQSGLPLRVVATFEDNLGHQETIISAATAPVAPNNDAPSANDVLITAQEDTAYILGLGDFGFSDPDVGDSLGAVRIESLPLAGSLTLNALAVNAGDVVSAAAIASGQLVFTPGANANGALYSSFGFSVRDSAGSFEASPNTLYVNVEAVNDNPLGQDKTVTILEDGQHVFAGSDFGFSDADAANGDSLRAVRIDSLPALGSLTLLGSAVSAGDLILVTDIDLGRLKFTPTANGNNTDGVSGSYASFGFTVQDLSLSFDTASNTITLDVTPVNDAPTGIPTISDTTPTEGTAVTVDVSAIADIDGLGPISRQWQSWNGSAWVDIVGATGTSFTPAQAQVNTPIRVAARYTDGDGTLETLFSAATTVVGDLYVGNNTANVRTFTEGQDVASGLGGADVFNALGGNDSLLGGSGNDTLNGGSGNDTLDGGANNDALNGGTDQDLLLGGDGADNLDGGEGNDSVDGGLGADILLGGEGNDTLTGGTDASADVLLGGAGADLMTGGAGNDTYEVDDLGDVVVETGLLTGGTDTIETDLASYSLGSLADVENLSFTGSDAVAFSGTGNAAGNRIEGGGSDDTLDGAGGSDTLVGGVGNDTYRVNLATDVITELAAEGIDTAESTAASYTLGAEVENLTLVGGAGNISGTGNALNNLIAGNEGNNTLSGLAGVDTIGGGAGNDTITYTLGDGADAVDGGADNDTLAITGTAASDVLDVIFDGVRLTGFEGGTVANVESVNANFTQAGTDTLSYVGTTAGISVNLAASTGSGFASLTGIEVVTAGSGADTLVGNAASATTLNGGAGNDTLTGGTGNDSLNGGDNDDLLDGGAGNDTMVGGLGNDTFVVDSALDVVTESGVGNDTIRATVTIAALAASVENLVLLGAANLNGTGNTGSNLIQGNDGNNVLSGGTGNVADTLIGGLGNDTFVYLMGQGADSINGGDGSDNDTLSVTGGAANDVLDVVFNGSVLTQFEGGTISAVENITADLLGGSDTLSYTGTTAAITVNLAVGSASGFASVTGIETVTGGAGADSLTGNGNTLNGAGGNDTLTGGALANVLNGDNDNDLLLGNGGNDTLNGGNGDDTLVGGLGADSINGGAGVSDWVSYAAETDNMTVDLALGTARRNGVLEDSLAGIENVSAGAGNDVLTSNGNNNILDGGAGNDLLQSGGGIDRLIGGQGNDTLNGGAGNDLFVFNTLDFDADLIEDFDAIGGTAATQDLLDFRGTGLTGGDIGGAIVIAVVGSNTLVTVNGTETIELLNVNGVGTNTIEASDFLFT